MLDGRTATLLANDAAKCADQVPKLDLADRLLGQVPLPRREIGGHARVVLLPGAAPLVQDAGRVAILLVFQQPPHKLLPRVVQFFLHLVGPRQHLLRLDLDQHACHGEELAHLAHIQLRQDLQVLQILVGDQHDGDIDDFHLVLADQVEKQVQRAAEDVEIDVKIHVVSLSVGRHNR